MWTNFRHNSSRSDKRKPSNQTGQRIFNTKKRNCLSYGERRESHKKRVLVTLLLQCKWAQTNCVMKVPSIAIFVVLHFDCHCFEYNMFAHCPILRQANSIIKLIFRLTTWNPYPSCTERVGSGEIHMSNGRINKNSKLKDRPM